MPLSKEHYKNYFLQQFNEILFDQTKLIDAIAGIKDLTSKGSLIKAEENVVKEKLQQYKPLTYDAILKDFDFGTTLGEESLRTKYFLDTANWPKEQRFFIGAAYSQAVANTFEKLTATDMVNDNLSPLEVDDLETTNPIAIEYQKLKEYVKDQGDLYKELGNSAVEAALTTFDFYHTISALKAVMETKSLTQEEFEKILFQPEQTEEGEKLQKQALKSIMRSTYDTKIKNLLELIKANNIETLDALNEKRAQLVLTEDAHKVSEQYGIDQSPIKFEPNIANFKAIDDINQLSTQATNLELKFLVGTIYQKLRDGQWETSIKEELSQSLETLEKTLMTIDTSCEQISRSSVLNTQQKSEINRHKDELFKATVAFADDSLSSPGTDDKNRTKYIERIKESEAQCRAILDDSTSRKILSALTNFLSHVTIVGMIANIVNKCTTGNWLLFKHTEESNKLKEVDQSVMALS